MIRILQRASATVRVCIVTAALARLEQSYDEESAELRRIRRERLSAQLARERAHWQSLRSHKKGRVTWGIA